MVPTLSKCSEKGFTKLKEQAYHSALGSCTESEFPNMTFHIPTVGVDHPLTRYYFCFSSSDLNQSGGAAGELSFCNYLCSALASCIVTFLLG